MTNALCLTGASSFLCPPGCHLDPAELIPLSSCDILLSQQQRAVWEPLLYSVGLPPQSCLFCKLGVILETSLTCSPRPCLILAPALLPGVCEAPVEGSVHLLQKEGLMQPGRILSSLLATAVPLHFPENSHPHPSGSDEKVFSVLCVSYCPNPSRVGNTIFPCG